MPLRIFSLLLLAAAAAAAERPNVVIVMADDMGYGDVRALNPRSKIPTPHLDRLAGQGMTFLDAHTPSAVCTPTRYGLLTGRYSWRTRLKKGVLNGYGEPLLAKDRETIGTFLGAQGYATGVVGKWHLGLGFRQDRRGRVRFQQAGQRRAAHPRLRLLLHHSGVARFPAVRLYPQRQDHRVPPRGAGSDQVSPLHAPGRARARSRPGEGAGRPWCARRRASSRGRRKKPSLSCCICR